MEVKQEVCQVGRPGSGVAREGGRGPVHKYFFRGTQTRFSTGSISSQVSGHIRLPKSYQRRATNLTYRANCRGALLWEPISTGRQSQQATDRRGRPSSIPYRLRCCEAVR
jgi:hypothetical protein